MSRAPATRLSKLDRRGAARGRIFGATGITAYLANVVALEAQEMAARESPRTTKLYNRTKAYPG
jgi:hypothetical protein